MCSEELGQDKLEAKVVHRTARLSLRTTRGQRRRCFSLLRSGGDLRAWVLDANRARHQAGQAPLTNYQALCRELAARGPASFGELGSVGARSVLRRYSSEWHSAAQRRKKGEKVGFPRRKKALVPIRYYHGTFSISHGRLRLSTARGSPTLELRLGRELPYDKDQVRSVTLVVEAGRLFVDVTAQVAVEPCRADPGVVAGVDLGIIHPYALASGQEALVVSGRAIRAEERLHLADTKARSAHMGRKAPRRGQRGSRRWRQLRRTQRQVEARHRRRVRHVHHQAAKQVLSWAKKNGVGTLVMGDPKGIATRDVGHRQNLRLRQWRRTHLLQALVDKATLAGMAVKLVDERGTSSTCPPVGLGSWPRGGAFPVPHAGSAGIEMWSVPKTSPPGAAGPRARCCSSRTVEPGHPRPGVTGVATFGTSTGPASLEAARHLPGVARRGGAGTAHQVLRRRLEPIHRHLARSHSAFVQPGKR